VPKNSSPLEGKGRVYSSTTGAIIVNTDDPDDSGNPANTYDKY